MPLPKKDKPLSKQIALKMTPEMHDALKAIPDYQEKLRELIRQWLENLENDGHKDS